MSRAERSDADGLVPVAIGTGIWVIVLVGLLVARPGLEESGTTWWIGVAAVGTISGVIGLVFLRWRQRRQRQA